MCVWIGVYHVSLGPGGNKHSWFTVTALFHWGQLRRCAGGQACRHHCHGAAPSVLMAGVPLLC